MRFRFDRKKNCKRRKLKFGLASRCVVFIWSFLKNHSERIQTTVQRDSDFCDFFRCFAFSFGTGML